VKIDSFVATSSIGLQKVENSKNDEKLREQTDAFESFLLKKILDIAIKKDENSIFGKDAGDKIYNSMYNDTMSKALGGGMGFSEMLFNFLKEAQKS
jgi:Rod binding domain-containing protein